MKLKILNKNFLYKLVATLFLVNLLFLSIFYLKDTQKLIQAYSEQDILTLIDKIKSSEVIAKTTRETKVYSDIDLKNEITKIPENEEVEILQDKSTEVYLVKSKTLKIKGWISKSDIEIPKDPETNNSQLTKSELETYINTLSLESETNFLIWVDIDRQLTYILKKNAKNWKLYKTLTCATGLNISPTTRGIFKTSDKGEWFYSNRLGSGAKYWVRFNNSYLFHSVAMDETQNIIDNTLGKRCSNGCVRLSVEDAKWLYETIPANTTVFVN